MTLIDAINEGSILRNQETQCWGVKCPQCGGIRYLRSTYPSKALQCYNNNTVCVSCRNENMPKGTLHHNYGKRWTTPGAFRGGKHTSETKELIRTLKLGRKASDITRKRVSQAVKRNWRKPGVKEKYYDALKQTKWIKVRTDKGQLELLNKWNRLGFHFEPNYQLTTKNFLCYIDGYDAEHNVVLEYDSAYHTKTDQVKKDLDRQNTIIDILRPKKFFRFNGVSKTFTQVIVNQNNKL